MYQWHGGWTDQPAERRLLDDLAQPGWAGDYPQSARPAAVARFAGGGTGQPMPGQPMPGQPMPGQRWYLAVSAGAAAVALASAVIVLLAYCSPRAVLMGRRVVTRPTATPSQLVAGPAPVVSAHLFTPSPVRATPPASAPGFVAVTFRLVERSAGGIIGEYTIANESDAVLSGWRFTAAFPGDQVQFVIGAADPDLGSDVLVLEPEAAGARLAPGGRVSVIFFAAGQTAGPVRCSFNGTAC